MRILKGVVDAVIPSGTWGAQIVDVPSLSPAFVIEGSGAWTASRPAASISSCAAVAYRIALGGFLTNCCVEWTMRTGYEKGYDVVTLKDCTATVSEEEQRAAVEKNYPMFSKPMTHDEFLSSLKCGKASKRSRALTRPPEANGRLGHGQAGRSPANQVVVEAPARSTSASPSSASSARHRPRASIVRARGAPTDRSVASRSPSLGSPRWTASRRSTGSRSSIGCPSCGATSCAKARPMMVETRGTFSLRSPVRPNPIGTA